MHSHQQYLKQMLIENCMCGQIIKVPVGSVCVPCEHGVSCIRYFGLEIEWYNVP
jgi:hypothetical protein